MRANEFINEGVFDSIKNAGRTANNKLSAMANSPAGQAAGNTLSRVGDWAKAKAYTGLGIGGAGGAGAAARQSFLNKFTSDYKRYMLSAKTGGMASPSMEDYVNTYIKKYGWTATPAQVQSIISGSAGDISKLANNMFALASDQSYDEFGRIGGRGGAKYSAASASTGVDADSDEGVVSPQGQKIVKQVGMMREPRDLTVTAKAAMNRLNKVDPNSYKELRQEVATGKNI
jgi:hypothetical protein